jgi:hypothetical protein
MAHLFWLSDEAWEAMDPYLPRGRPGKPRVDDRRGSAASSTCSRQAAAGAMCRPSTVRPPRSTTAQPLVPARPLAAPVREAGRHRRDSRGTEPRQFSRGGTPARAGEKGGVDASGRALTRWSHLRSIAWPMIVADRSPSR